MRIIVICMQEAARRRLDSHCELTMLRQSIASCKLIVYLMAKIFFRRYDPCWATHFWAESIRPAASFECLENDSNSYVCLIGDLREPSKKN